MLLYLSSEENSGLCDFMGAETGLVIKKLIGEFDLKQFVVRDMKNLGHYRFIAIDYSALRNSDEEIIEALDGMKALSDMRIILFAEKQERGSSQIEKLVGLGIYNIILSTDYYEIKDEFRKCCSEDGMAYIEALRLATINEESIIDVNQRMSFKGENVRIAVSGTMQRIGTTTIAINLANYLASIGAKVGYIEANGNDHLKSILNAERVMKKVGEECEYRGVKYLNSSDAINSDYDFLILDLGVINQEKALIMKACDIRILVAGGKAYEIENTIKGLTILSDKATNVIFNFVPGSQELSIKRLVGEAVERLHFAVCSPDLFSWEANKVLFQNIIEPNE